MMSVMPTRLEQKAATRAGLLDAAAVLVASRGVDGATVDAIASAAGVTSGAVYASFRGKRELLAALAAERTADLSRVPLAELASTLGERLEGLLADNPIEARLLNELLAAAGRDEGLRHEMAAGVLRNVEVLTSRLAAEGARTVLPARETALLLQVLVAGCVSLRQVLGDELPASLLTDALALLQEQS
jgi:AcrR family transcriptional regulator